MLDSNKSDDHPHKEKLKTKKCSIQYEEMVKELEKRRKKEVEKDKTTKPNGVANPSNFSPHGLPRQLTILTPGVPLQFGASIMF